jgi:hypothetical protein
MHFEVPKAKSIREFGGEYLMIVISILTALALEAVVEKFHHSHVAHEASVRIDSELRSNIELVKSAMAHNAEREKRLYEVRNQMLAALRQKLDDAAFMARYENEWKSGVQFSLLTPSLRREAWEAAVASQAATWMTHATLERYANSYAEIRDFSTQAGAGTTLFLDGPRMEDVLTNIDIGAGNPKDIVRTVTQMIHVYNSTNGNLRDLKRVLETATAAPHA